jgi:Phosphotransferase system IIA components
MDIDYYRDKGVDITTPLIVTNFRDFDLEYVDEGEVQAGIDNIITIK